MTAHAHQDLDQLSINTIRTLSMDAVQQAKSGHPGTPMAMAPVVYTLWQRFLRFDPDEPDLAESRSLRAVDRSCLDAALFDAPPGRCEVGQSEVRGLGTPAVSLDDIRHFRQLDSKCPGTSRIPSDVRRRDDDRSARDRAWRPASGWRWRRDGWRRTSTGPASRCSTTTSTRSAETAT